MIDNKFVKRYKKIPIARYTSDHTARKQAWMPTPLHNHKEFEIIYVQEGQIDVNVSNQNIKVKDGDIICINPYALHSITVDENSRFKQICFCFNLSLISTSVLSAKLEENRLSIYTHFPTTSEHYKNIQKLFLNIDEAFVEENDYWDMVVKGNLTLLFAYFFQNGLIRETEQHTKETEFCINVLQYIEEKYKTSIDSRIVAKDLHYNQSYFCRIFKKNFGVCFSEYLNQFRIEKAKSLFENSNLSITEIAMETGFSDASYFSKCFKKQNNISPKAFREKFIIHQGKNHNI